ncbi:MAG: molybdenum cofactor biosynthesis protein B [Candidatus Aminicenantales bacterium]
MLAVTVITISDRAYRGEYEDLSGPKIKEIIEASGLEAKVKIKIVPDDKEAVRQALLDNLDQDYIFTTGGTGLSPRDITPEITEEICDKEIPGLSEMLRRESYKETKNAVLSRGYSGLKGKTIIVNFPGSVKAVSLCTRLMLPIMEHAHKMVHGGQH